jgi:transcriptional regulator with GAF, ATPase, and Fis domain
MLKYFKTIGEIQGTIANATTLEEALQGGLKVIVESAGAAGGAIWYADKAGDGALHPYFWIGPVDLTRRSHAPGDGSVGRVFESQRAERLFEFDALQDVETAIDFKGMEVASMVCVPFSSNTSNIGTIQFVNTPESGPFTDEGADVMEIMAMMAAIALEENESLAEPWQPGEVVMELRDITREFQNGDVVTKVLKGVNLDVYEGEFLVLWASPAAANPRCSTSSAAWTAPPRARSTTWARIFPAPRRTNSPTSAATTSGSSSNPIT